MTLTYRFAGFIASIGILLYTLITLFIFWLVGGVLTLPGIAAIVIGIGMAVDACVISFSRMKDEQKNGENLKNAFKKGNKNSFMTILDANLTTLIVAIILFLFGESSVKGFATMLIISILVTLFVMVFVMRWLLKLFIETDYFNEHWNYFIGNIKKKQNQFDFLKHRNKMWIGFIILFLIGTILLTTQGLKLGVDFKGGTVINVGANHTLEKEKIQKEIETKNYTIYEVEAQDEQSLTLKIEETLTKEEVLQLQTTIQNNYQASTDIGVVSNIVKQELIKNAFLSLILAAIGMIIYVSIRFEWTYAVCGIIALLHDVLMILFAFCLFKLEISSIFIAAILSIVGYSINDTIVVFDRIRENIKTKQKDQIKTKTELYDVINLSLRSSIARSIITTITTLIPVICLILFGSKEILNFNLALLFGLIFGTISSLFIAAQLLYILESHHIGKPRKKKWYEEEEIEEKKIKGVNC